MSGEIKKQLRSGMLINFFTKYTSVFIQIGLGAILARILSPKEFGVVAVVTVFIEFFKLMSQMGIGPAVVQKKNLDTDEIFTLFSATIVAAGLLGVLFFWLAKPIAAFFNDDLYVYVCHLLAYSIFLNTLNIVPQSLMRKKKQFLSIGLIDIAAQIITGLLAIYWALEGYSYFALIFKSILGAAFRFVLTFLISGVLVTWRLKLSGITKVFSYSAYQMMFNFLNYFSRNLDNLLIGKFLGETPLGFYDKAYRLMLQPVRNLTFVITPVLHPVLSDYQHKKDVIFDAYCKLSKILALIGIPVSVFMFFAAEEIILLLYGNQWGGTIPLLQILAPAIWLQVIASSSGAVYQSSNSTKLLFTAGIIGVVFNVTGMVVGLKFGLQGVAAGITIAKVINFVPNYVLLIKGALKQKLAPFFKVLLKPIGIGCILIFCFTLYECFAIDLPLWLSLLVKVVIFATVSFIAMKVTNEWETIKRIRK